MYWVHEMANKYCILMHSSIKFSQQRHKFASDRVWKLTIKQLSNKFWNLYKLCKTLQIHLNW
jgi:hypothetical protein